MNLENSPHQGGFSRLAGPMISRGRHLEFGRPLLSAAPKDEADLMSHLKASAPWKA
jgi:hypothetical protein